MFIFSTVAALVALSAPARAGLYTICAVHRLGFTDAYVAVGDDYLNDNTDIAARGIRIQVVRNSDGALLFNDYADEDGTDIGCIGPLLLSSSETYQLRVKSDASILGNTVLVLDNDTDEDRYSYAWPNWTPGANNRPTLFTPVRDQWHILAVASWALWNSDAVGMSGEELVFYTQTCASGGSCFSGEDPDDSMVNGRVYVCPDDVCTTEPNDSFARYLIAHEMGHLVAYLLNDHDPNCSGYDLEDECTGLTAGEYGGHRMWSEEYQTAALSEGLAHFWAAYAFNDASENDCGWKWYSWHTNFNNDATGNDDAEFSCEAGPNPTDLPSIDGTDYHGDVCSGGTGHAVEYDWLRFWWDMVTDGGVSIEQVYQIWDTADPDTWDCDGSDPVAASMLYAAQSISLPLGATYNSLDDANGVHR